MERNTVLQALEDLLAYAADKRLIEEEDKVYCRNRLGLLLGLTDFSELPPPPDADNLPLYPAVPLQVLTDYAAEQGLLDPESGEARDRFDTELMDVVSPFPSQVSRGFYARYSRDLEDATDFLYDLNKTTNYIRCDRIAKDQQWSAPTPYGELQITINLSKPEKDPKAIAAAKLAPQSGYPKCALCLENMGFSGGPGQPPRANHRPLPLSLGEETWYLQYSPYVYYNEHCIVFSEAHRPMAINRDTFVRLLDLVTGLPHYFMGSNADLPIVGGSILSHDHFQGGKFHFPMAMAQVDQPLAFHAFPQVEAGFVNWPLSVLRLTSLDKEALVTLADQILTVWRGYSHEESQIQAFTGDVPHNTITPIARRQKEYYQLDLVLRNNRTTPEHPLGLFHPHAQYHHIKQENIGLIEVMGLAILPPRLLEEITLLQQALEQQDKAQALLSAPEMEKHLPWYQSLAAQPAADRGAQIRQSIGEIFAALLDDCGVFKNTAQGRVAFWNFCQAVNALSVGGAGL